MRLIQGRAGLALPLVLGLLIATGATAGAASLITGKQIKNGTITSRDLSKAVQTQLKKPGVPGPKGDVGPVGPKGETGLKGDPGSVAPTEPVHYVGDPGEPGFEANWTANGAKTVGFFKDTSGVVHLQGTVSASAAATALLFGLPPGYRPSADQSFTAATPFAGPTPAVVDPLLVSSNGAVEIQLSGSGARQRSLSGISFRAG